jgi:hypothetical protein
MTRKPFASATLLAAALCWASAEPAEGRSHLTVAPNASASSPATTNNDDSCDISLLPAATLLLPYFEVETDFKIWREGQILGSAACSEYASNSALLLSETVRFDERENPMTLMVGCGFICQPAVVSTAAALRRSVSDPNFPPLSA